MKLKNSITLALMTASIVLLLVLQILWLQNSYEKAFYDLRRDSNYLFRNTLFSIRDSLFFKNVKAVPPDNVESIKIYKNSPDSLRVSMQSSTVQVIVKNSSHVNKDSLFAALQPMAQV